MKRRVVPAVVLALVGTPFVAGAGGVATPAPATAPSPAPAVTSGSTAAASSISRQYLLAEQAYAEGDYAQAEQLYSKIIETHGDEPTAWFRIGLIQQRRESFKAALAAYDNALACGVDPQSELQILVLAKARYNRALLLLQGASRDLNNIPPGVLDSALDQTRESLARQVNGVLQTADAEGTSPPRSVGARKSSARGYVYEAKSVSVTVEPIQEATP